VAREKVNDLTSKVVVRHHQPAVPDYEALLAARDIWSSGLIRQFRRLRNSHLVHKANVEAGSTREVRRPPYA